MNTWPIYTLLPGRGKIRGPGGATLGVDDSCDGALPPSLLEVHRGPEPGLAQTLRTSAMFELAAVARRRERRAQSRFGGSP